MSSSTDGLESIEAELTRQLAGPSPGSEERVGLPASAQFASSIGNQAMSRVAARYGDDGGGRDEDPRVDMLRRGAALAEREARPEASMLQRALARAEEGPVSPAVVGAAVPAGGRCSCGGAVLPGGECTKCMASRLARQGMARTEVQRMVLARVKLARQQAGGQRTTIQCINANLANAGIPWAIIGILGGVCGVLGAVAGLAGGPAAPATSPSGAAVAAAVCIAGVTGLSIGTVLGVITRCIQDPSVEWVFASNEAGEGAEGGGGEGATATA
jgi:hypothetical protein